MLEARGRDKAAATGTGFEVRVRAMMLESPGSRLVLLPERPPPVPRAGELLIAVAACGVCRTDLHVVDGDMSDIPGFPYALLWQERELVSVANLTSTDAREFPALAPRAGVKTEITRYPLAAANEARADRCEGRLQGAAVLLP
jgi:D-arabinose 1-dehydrogenase-like Zn-dependent alcohol dehydrogenase